jgi:hypothetical protein
MNFIEALFGVSPDGGSGVLEFVLFLMPIIAATLVGSIRIWRARRLHALVEVRTVGTVPHFAAPRPSPPEPSSAPEFRRRNAKELFHGM